MKNALIFTLTLLFGLHVFNYAATSTPEGVVFDFQPPIFVDSQDPEVETNETQTKVPILMYHYVRDIDINQDQIGWNLSTSVEDFDRQMQYLAENGYVSIHLADLEDGVVPDNAVVISFDDGLSDFYTNALPILQKYNMTASNSIISGMQGGNHMTLEQIREAIDYGIEITAHTVTHPNLTNLTREDAKFQIESSKESIENQLGIEVDYFVYPAGKYNLQIVDQVEAAGFKMALTTIPGVADLETDNPYILPRIRIDNRDGYEGFVKKMEEAAKEVSG